MVATIKKNRHKGRVKSIKFISSNPYYKSRGKNLKIPLN
jgi:hypothetical protein